MVNRINLILKAKNITPRQFADEIGIQPSGMSHIMSGRNNPSLDFVMKVVRRYPEIDIKWLMFGQGEMYSTVTPPTIPQSTATPAPTSAPAPTPQASTILSQQSAVPPQPAASPVQPTAAPQPMAPPTQQSAAPTLTFAPAQPAAEPVPIEPEPDLFSEIESTPSPSYPASAPQQSQVFQSTSVSQQSPSVPTLQSPQPTSVSQLMMSAAPNAIPNESGINDSPLSNGEEKRNLVKETDQGKKKRIVKVVILYDDHSFSEYYPE